MKIILASTSERRQKIFSLLGLHFTSVEPGYQETDEDHLNVKDQALAHAIGKAKSVAAQYKNALIIGSDTIIELNGKKIGKPKNLTDAKNILQQLSDQSHQIYTAICMMDTQTNETLCHVETIQVFFKKLDDAMIDQYLQTDYVLDKAGAYALQGNASQLIHNIEGDILAGIGLPLKPLVHWLKAKHVIVNEEYGSLDKLEMTSCACTEMTTRLRRNLS